PYYNILTLNLHYALLFFNITSPNDTYSLSLHDALPISLHQRGMHPLGKLAARELGKRSRKHAFIGDLRRRLPTAQTPQNRVEGQDRKSTRLNSSHVANSYAVFCLKKKNQQECRYRYRMH